MKTSQCAANGTIFGTNPENAVTAQKTAQFRAEPATKRSIRKCAGLPRSPRTHVRQRLAMAYDEDCWVLADSFLSDCGTDVYTDQNVDELAQTIQDAIEDFIREKEALRG
jgi:hypothetical protein